AAIMPVQSQLGHANTQAFIKNAFQVLDVVFTTSLPRIVDPIEEIRRRKLFRVTYANQLLSTGDASNRVPHWYLGRLVEYDDVELGMRRVKVLGHRERRHQ